MHAVDANIQKGGSVSSVSTKSLIELRNNKIQVGFKLFTGEELAQIKRLTKQLA